MKVAWFPQTGDLAGNPYWRLLHHNLEALGVEFETSHSGHWMECRWLWHHRRHVNVLHFHFVQPQYAGPNERVSFKRLLKFAGYLALARLLGYRIVWTVHDLMPTWPMAPFWMERLGRYLIAWVANDVIVHCERARHLLAQQLCRSHRVWVLPHPSYADAYLNDVSRATARERLNIEQDRFVVAFLGGIRPNKGIERLIAAFAQLSDPKAMLMIAGRPWPPESYVEEICGLVTGDPRIRIRTEAIPDEDLQLYINAANVLTFPFEHVLTSGSVMLAMSFGRPVIVPCLGCLPELVGNDAGIIYDPGGSKGLVAALHQAMESDLVSMGAAAARRANAVSWRDLALATAKIYGAT